MAGNAREHDKRAIFVLSRQGRLRFNMTLAQLCDNYDCDLSN